MAGEATRAGIAEALAAFEAAAARVAPLARTAAAAAVVKATAEAALAQQLRGLERLLAAVRTLPPDSAEAVAYRGYAKWALDEAAAMAEAAETGRWGASAAAAPAATASATTAAAHAGSADRRVAAVRELVDTERRYVESLRTFLRVFGEALRPLDDPADRGVAAAGAGGGAASLLNFLSALLTPHGSASTSAPASAPAPAPTPTSAAAADVETRALRSLLSPHDYHRLFDPYTRLLPLHEMVLADLQADVNGEARGGNAGLIMARYAQFFRTYSDMFGAFKANQEAVAGLAAAHDGVFSRWLERVVYSATARATGPGGGKSMQSYMIEPVQRIPRYALLLGNIARETAEAHPDRPRLMHALAVVTDVAHSLEDVLRQAESQTCLADLAYRFLPPLLELIQPHRRLVVEGDLAVGGIDSGTTPVHALLCNDRLVMATPLPLGRWYAYATLTPVDVTVVTPPAASSSDKLWAFDVLGRETSHRCYAASETERTRWVTAIRETLRDRALARHIASVSTRGSFSGAIGAGAGAPAPGRASLPGTASAQTAAYRAAAGCGGHAHIAKAASHDSGMRMPAHDVAASPHHAVVSPLAHAHSDGDVRAAMLGPTPPASERWAASEADFGASAAGLDAAFMEEEDEPAPIWQSNDVPACAVCGRGFRFLETKHHCRKCGMVCCGNCSMSRIRLRKSDTEPQRTCDTCMAAWHAVKAMVRPSRPHSLSHLHVAGASPAIASSFGFSPLATVASDVTLRAAAATPAAVTAAPAAGLVAAGVGVVSPLSHEDLASPPLSAPATVSASRLFAGDEGVDGGTMSAGRHSGSIGGFGAAHTAAAAAGGDGRRRSRSGGDNDDDDDPSGEGIAAAAAATPATEDGAPLRADDDAAVAAAWDAALQAAVGSDGDGASSPAPPASA